MAKWTTKEKAVAIGAAVLTGLLVLQSRRHYREHNGAPVVLDPDLKSETRGAVLAALSRETDPNVLRILAQKLDAAGYHLSAHAVSQRIVALYTRGSHVA